MLITQAEWARHRGFSRQYVRRLVQKGLVRLIDGKVDPDQADAALDAVREPARPVRRSTPADAETATPNTANVSRPAQSSPETASLPQGGDLPTLLLKTRIKSETERGKLLELKAKVEAGRYVDADEVKVAAFNRGRIVRDNLLNVAGRLAAVVAAESDERRCFEVIDGEIRQAIVALTGAEADE